MTIKELCELLNTLPPEWEVCLRDENGFYTYVFGIEYLHKSKKLHYGPALAHKDDADLIAIV